MSFKIKNGNGGDVASFPSLLTGYHQRLVFIKYDLPVFHSVKNTRLIDSKIPRNICRWMSSFFNSEVRNQCPRLRNFSLSAPRTD